LVSYSLTITMMHGPIYIRLFFILISPTIYKNKHPVCYSNVITAPISRRDLRELFRKLTVSNYDGGNWSSYINWRLPRSDPFTSHLHNLLRKHPFSSTSFISSSKRLQPKRGHYIHILQIFIFVREPKDLLQNLKRSASNSGNNG